MSQILAVLRKELIDGLRDKRSVMSALLFPLLAPMLVTFMLNLQAERQRLEDRPDDQQAPAPGDTP